MANVDFTYINTALTRTGNAAITSLEDGTIGADIAAENYETIVKAELSNHPWKRAKKYAVLSLIDSDDIGEPPAQWDYAYQLPGDFVDIVTVRVAGIPIDYALGGDLLFADYDDNSTLEIEYVWRIPELWFLPWFAEGLTRRLEAVFLRSIGERYREAALRDKAADEQFARGRNRDSQQEPPKDRLTSTTLAARTA